MRFRTFLSMEGVPRRECTSAYRPSPGDQGNRLDLFAALGYGMWPAQAGGNAPNGATGRQLMSRARSAARRCLVWGLASWLVLSAVLLVRVQVARPDVINPDFAARLAK